MQRKLGATVARKWAAAARPSGSSPTGRPARPESARPRSGAPAYHCCWRIIRPLSSLCNPVGRPQGRRKQSNLFALSAPAPPQIAHLLLDWAPQSAQMPQVPQAHLIDDDPAQASRQQLAGAVIWPAGPAPHICVWPVLVSAPVPPRPTAGSRSLSRPAAGRPFSPPFCLLSAPAQSCKSCHRRRRLQSGKTNSSWQDTSRRLASADRCDWPAARFHCQQAAGRAKARIYILKKYFSL